LSSSQPLTDCSQKSQLPSHDLVYACEPNILHTALILPTFLCCNYSHVLHHLCNTTWLAYQHALRTTGETRMESVNQKLNEKLLPSMCKN